MAQYTLPDWARFQPQLLAGPNNPALTSGQIGNTSVSGGGTGLLDIEGFYNGGLGQFAGRQEGNGDAQSFVRGDYDGFNDWLRSTGQSLFESGGDGQIARWMQDGQGNITAEPQYTSTDDEKFGIAAALAAAVTGANLYGAYGGAGAAAEGGAAAGVPEAGIKTMGTIAPGAGPVAPLAATGQMSTAPLITAGIPQAGAAAGGLFGTSQLGQAANGLLDYAKSNPKLVGGLLGGLTGATGGLESGGDGEAPYTGQMPTIERGGWQPRAQAQQMPLPQFGGGMKTTQGAQGSGLWRFMGGNK